MKSIRLNGLRPFLRYARIIDVSPDYGYNGVIAYDARLVYVLEGTGNLDIGARSYPLAAGTLLAWQAGEVYGFSDVPESGLRIVMLNFDYAGDSPDPKLTAPDKPEDFSVERLNGVYAMTENADANGVIFDGAGFWAESSLRELLDEYKTRRVYSETLTGSLLTTMLTKLCRRARIRGVSPIRADANADAIIAYIHAHLGEKLSYESLGRAFSYHPNHINRIITRATGLSLHRYLIRLRIEKAYGYLSDEGLSVSETAERCGFADPMSFAKSFRRQTGQTPSEVRRKR